MAATEPNRGGEPQARALPTADELYERFLEHAEQVRLRFPIITDPWPPHERDLPGDDGMPVDSERHMVQRIVLLQTLRDYWADRPRGYVAVNMGVYFNIDHVRKTYDWIDPDFFAVADAEKRMRDCWVEWDEGCGPDIVIELMSPSTYQRDKVERFRTYQDVLRVPEYFWYDPFTEEFAGFRLHEGSYQPIELEKDGSLFSQSLGLSIAPRDTLCMRDRGRYLRFLTPSGVLLPTSEERHEMLEAYDARARSRDGGRGPSTVLIRAEDDAVRQRIERVRQEALAFLQRPDLDDETRHDIERRLAELDGDYP